jgi:hypothetical protein
MAEPLHPRIDGLASALEHVCKMPEAIDCDRQEHLQAAHHEKMDALIKQMWETPVRTAEGRRAKVQGLLTCVMGAAWTHVDERTDYQELTARNLLCDLIGGEPGGRLREQFA